LDDAPEGHALPNKLTAMLANGGDEVTCQQKDSHSRKLPSYYCGELMTFFVEGAANLTKCASLHAAPFEVCLECDSLVRALNASYAEFHRTFECNKTVDTCARQYLG